jgi:subtilisin family serine protease
LLLASAAHAQIVSTRCATSVVHVPYDLHGARVLGECNGAQPDNVMWNLDRADQVEGALDGEFNRRIDGTGSVIYIIDSGIMASHDEFRTRDGGSKVIAGFDLLKDIFGGAMPCDGNWALNACTNWELGVLIDGHGTAVASAAAGNRVGVAPGAKLVSVRAFGFPALTPPRLIEALDTVIRHAWSPDAPQFRTGIVNLSVGLPRFDIGVENKIRQMIAGVDRNGTVDPVNGKSFFFTFFGGNANSSHCDGATTLVVFPSNRGANIRGAVTVGGTEAPNKVWSWSCRGDGIEVLAPAADVLVASLTGRDHYRMPYLSSGTSYAAPYVAGIAARMLQQNPNLTPEELEERIEATPARVDDPGIGAAGGRLAVFPMEKLERTPTRCATADVAVGTIATDKTLVGCGDGFSENVLWHLDRADGVMDMAATRRTRGRGAVVYVVDSGVMASHTEFARADGSRVIGALDPALEMAPPGTTACSPLLSCYSGPNLLFYTHGTAVASVIAGRNTGVAPDASIVAVRSGGFAVKFGSTETDIFVRALDQIVRHAFEPATPQFQTGIVNMSTFPPGASPSLPSWVTFEKKMRAMINGVDKDGNPDPNGKRFLFVSAAGNAGQCSSSTGAVVNYPSVLGSQIDGLITVGGIDRTNHVWSGSCVGGAVDILAPAQNLLVASISGADRYRGKAEGRDYTSGTSYATPYVSGIAARILEDEPALTPVELEQRIKASGSYAAGLGAPAGGRVAVLIDNEPPAQPPRRRAAGKR